MEACLIDFNPLITRTAPYLSLTDNREHSSSTDSSTYLFQSRTSNHTLKPHIAHRNPTKSASLHTSSLHPPKHYTVVLRFVVKVPSFYRFRWSMRIFSQKSQRSSSSPPHKPYRRSNNKGSPRHQQHPLWYVHPNCRLWFVVH